MDRLLESCARLLVLEGMAGVEPRTYVGRGDSYALDRGMKQARAALPGLSPEWFDMGTTVLLEAIRAGAVKSATAEDVEDLVGQILGGLSRSEGVHGELYDVGRKLGVARLVDVASRVRFHAACRVSGRDRELVQSVPVLPDVAVPESGAAREQLLRSGGDLTWVSQALEMAWVRSPGRLAIARVWLSDVGQSAVQVARVAGHGEGSDDCWIDKTGSATYVSQIIRNIPKAVSSHLSL